MLSSSNDSLAFSSSTQESRDQQDQVPLQVLTQFKNLTYNLEQAEDYVAQLTKDKERLLDMHSECNEILQYQFERVRTALNRREEILLAQLDQKYKDRDDKLQYQIDQLQNHLKKTRKLVMNVKIFYQQNGIVIPIPIKKNIV